MCVSRVHPCVSVCACVSPRPSVCVSLCVYLCVRPCVCPCACACLSPRPSVCVSVCVHVFIWWVDCGLRSQGQTVRLTISGQSSVVLPNSTAGRRTVCPGPAPPQHRPLGWSRRGGPRQGGHGAETEVGDKQRERQTEGGGRAPAASPPLPGARRARLPDALSACAGPGCAGASGQLGPLRG